jgi:hypothetical protein
VESRRGPLAGGEVGLDRVPCSVTRDLWGAERRRVRTILRLRWEEEKTCVASAVLGDGVRRFPAHRAGLTCDAPIALTGGEETADLAGIRQNYNHPSGGMGGRTPFHLSCSPLRYLDTI